MLEKQPPCWELRLGILQEAPKHCVECVSESSGLEREAGCTDAPAPLPLGGVKPLVLPEPHRCWDGWVVPTAGVGEAESRRSTGLHPLLSDRSISFHLPPSMLSNFHPSTGLPELPSFSSLRPMSSSILEVKSKNMALQLSLWGDQLVHCLSGNFLWIFYPKVRGPDKDCHLRPDPGSKTWTEVVARKMKK